MIINLHQILLKLNKKPFEESKSNSKDKGNDPLIKGNNNIPNDFRNSTAKFVDIRGESIGSFSQKGIKVVITKTIILHFTNSLNLNREREESQNKYNQINPSKFEYSPEQIKKSIEMNKIELLKGRRSMFDQKTHLFNNIRPGNNETSMELSYRDFNPNLNSSNSIIK